MSGRRFRRLLILAAVVGLAYWIWKDRPTLSGIVDTLTSPLFGSKAAVKGGEHKRVMGDATQAISEQEDLPVGALKEGMTRNEIRQLLGNPDKQEELTVEGVEQIRWTYERARRILTFREGRVVAIAVR